MTNKERYLTEINSDPEYRTTIAEFKDWLTRNNMTDTFKRMLKSPDLDEYDIAVDFSIPVSMVKHFQKVA